STIAPSAGPWLSPQVVTRKTRPNVLIDTLLPSPVSEHARKALLAEAAAPRRRRRRAEGKERRAEFDPQVGLVHVARLREQADSAREADVRTRHVVFGADKHVGEVDVVPPGERAVG